MVTKELLIMLAAMVMSLANTKGAESLKLSLGFFLLLLLLSKCKGFEESVFWDFFFLTFGLCLVKTEFTKILAKICPHRFETELSRDVFWCV